MPDTDTKIFAVTAMNENFIKDIYHLYGIEDVLTKPVSLETITPIINSVFSNWNISIKKLKNYL